MGQRPLQILYFLQRGNRRQILTAEVDPSTVRVNPL